MDKSSPPADDARLSGEVPSRSAPIAELRRHPGLGHKADAFTKTLEPKDFEPAVRLIGIVRQPAVAGGDSNA